MTFRFIRQLFEPEQWAFEKFCRELSLSDQDLDRASWKILTERLSDPCPKCALCDTQDDVVAAYVVRKEDVVRLQDCADRGDLAVSQLLGKLGLWVQNPHQQWKREFGVVCFSNLLWLCRHHRHAFDMRRITLVVDLEQRVLFASLEQHFDDVVHTANRSLLDKPESENLNRLSKRAISFHLATAQRINENIDECRVANLAGNVAFAEDKSDAGDDNPFAPIKASDGNSNTSAPCEDESPLRASRSRNEEHKYTEVQ